MPALSFTSGALRSVLMKRPADSKIVSLWGQGGLGFRVIYACYAALLWCTKSLPPRHVLLK